MTEVLINRKTPAGSVEAGDTTQPERPTRAGRARRGARRRPSRARKPVPSEGDPPAESADAPAAEAAPAKARKTRAPSRRRKSTKAAKKTSAKRTRKSAQAEPEAEKAPARRRSKPAAAEKAPARRRSKPDAVEKPAPERATPPPRRPSRAARSSGLKGVAEFFAPETLDACQRAIGYYFRDHSLLHMALTHSSIKNEERPSYERLEFLGDSVVGLVVAEYIYKMLPDCDEGELTKVKSAVVSTDGLAVVAGRLGLDRFLAVGRGIQMNDALPKSLMADVFEGVAGAVYLDRGYEAVRLYILDHLRASVEEALSDRGARNFKSVLQQVAQRDFGETPRYDVLSRRGPDHARVFTVVAVVGDRKFGSAAAPTKKEAEQAAAKLALKTILMAKSRKRGGGGGETGEGGRRKRRSRKRAS